MKEKIKERISRLQCIMKERGINFYLITDKDPHQSEYCADNFKLRTLYSGFTGSNGTLLVGEKESCLWTDGRYFIQAEKELEGSGIILMRQGEKDVPTITGFLAEKRETLTLGMDGESVNYGFLRNLRKEWEEKHLSVKEGEASGIALSFQADLARECLTVLDSAWNPEPEVSKWFLLSEELTGESTAEKIAKIREELKKKGAECFLSCALDKNMWILNARAHDIPCNPVGYSYVLITEEEAVCFAYGEALSEEIRKAFKEQDVKLADYSTFYEGMLKACEGKRVATEVEELNVKTYAILEGCAEKIIDFDCGVNLRKACKNPREIEKIKETYIKDSVAVCRFLYWLSEQDVSRISELDAGKKMDEIRLKETEGCFDLSFETIAAYGANAAMMHYEATPEHYSMLKPEGMFLLDSGGQYFGGTTDVTRTVALGPVTEEMKEDYTKTLRGMLALQNAVFIKGATGVSLDILARRPMWESLMDYKCGTGHGIGYILNVHEGPQAVRTKSSHPKKDAEIFPGMILSDEPGVYKEGKYGIRIENILLCVEKGSSADGDFYAFEPLTYVPFDMSLIKKDKMNSEELRWLEDYNRQVYEKISPYLSEKERDWLAVIFL